MPAKAEEAVERIALTSLGRLIEATPVRYYGNVRKGWIHRVISPMHHVVVNPSRIMRFLEFGTKAHGPKHAKALFIPLNQTTSEAGPREVMEANARARLANQWRNYARAAASKTPLRSHYLPSYPFVVGRDFVWAKRVRGITAMRIAAKEQIVVKKEIKDALKGLLIDAIRG
jgi:hypothetical protein